MRVEHEFLVQGSNMHQAIDDSVNTAIQRAQQQSRGSLHSEPAEWAGLQGLASNGGVHGAPVFVGQVKGDKPAERQGATPPPSYRPMVSKTQLARLHQYH